MIKDIKKGIILFLTIFLISIFSIPSVFAQSITPNDILKGNNASQTENNLQESATDVVKIVREIVLPIIPIFIVVGSIIYFLLGIRSKEKREKGIGIMIGALVLYLILQLVPLILQLIELKAFNGITVTAYQVTNVILKEIQLISLPLTVLFIIIGYTISNTVGARNMQKKRIGDTMVIGSVIFFAFVNAITFLYPVLFKQ